jgi:5-oxoprolinase (ATP-hydrolysing)
MASSMWLCMCCSPLQAVLDSGISSIAVVLKHAAIYPDHEKAVGQLAQEMGFTQVRLLAGAAHLSKK